MVPVVGSGFPGAASARFTRISSSPLCVLSLFPPAARRYYSRKEYLTHAVVMLLTFSPVGENVEVFNSPVLHFLSTGNISQKFEKWQLAVKHYFSSFSQHVLNGVKFKYFITGNPSQLKCPISQ